MGKGLSIIIGVIAAVVIVVVIVVILVVVVFGGIDTSPITEITETIAVTKPDGGGISIEDKWYWTRTKVDGTAPDNFHKYTWALTNFGGDTATYTFTNTAERVYGAFTSELFLSIDVTDSNKYYFTDPLDVADPVVEGSFTKGEDDSVQDYGKDFMRVRVGTGETRTYAFYYNSGDWTWTKSTFTLNYK